MLALNLLWFVLACVAMTFSGTWLVKSLAKMARFMHLSEFVVSFIIMAFATSVPELFVGITSALAKNPSLALGNVLGANILGLTMALGIAVLLGRGIKIESKGIKKDAFSMVSIVMLPLILFLIGGGLSRLDGVFLVTVFIIYSIRLIKRGKRFEKEFEHNPPHRKDAILATLLFVASIALLFVSATFVVKYANLLSVDLMLPPIMIGLFLISLGTTLPEITFGSRAALMGHGEMTLGNQIGSVVTNSTLILGITAIIYPIEATFSLFLISAVFLVLVTFLLATFIDSSDKLNIKEGIALILLYIFFVIVEFYVKGIFG